MRALTNTTSDCIVTCVPGKKSRSVYADGQLWGALRDVGARITGKKKLSAEPGERHVTRTGMGAFLLMVLADDAVAEAAFDAAQAYDEGRVKKAINLLKDAGFKVRPEALGEQAEAVVFPHQDEIDDFEAIGGQTDQPEQPPGPSENRAKA